MSIHTDRPIPGSDSSSSALSRRLFIASLFVLAIITLFIIFFPKTPLENTVQNGVADVSDLQSGSVVLSGEWKILEDTQRPERAGSLAFVPGQWKRPYGYASYQATITGLNPDISWVIATTQMDTSYRLSIDGLAVLSGGKPGKTEAETISAYQVGIVRLPAGARSVDIILEVANFTHLRGGPYRGLILGEEAYLRKYDDWSFVTEIATVCIMAFLGGLALINALVKKRIASFWFGCMLFSGAVGIFTLSPDFPAFRILPDLTWAVYVRGTYAFVYLVTLWFFLIARSLFGGFSFRRTLAISAPSIGLTLCSFLLPIRLFTTANFVYEINSLLLSALAIVIFVRALRKRYPYSILLGIGFLTFIGVAISVILYANNRIYRGSFSPLSFLYPLFGSSLSASFYLDIASYIISLVGLNLFSILFFIDSLKVTEPSPQATQKNYQASVNERCIALGFSPREIEVTLLALEGKRNREIAEALFVSDNTVKTHLSRIFAKAGIKARSELFAAFTGN